VSGEDGAVYFFQKNSTAICQFQFSYEVNGYRSLPLSKLAGHLVYHPTSSALWKGNDVFETNILFFVNGDGTMVCCSIDGNERIAAFSRITCPWLFSEVCVVGDGVFVGVVDGTTIRVMRFDDATFTDDGHHYESSIGLLPLTDGNSSYRWGDVAVTAVYAHISNTSSLKIGDDVVYKGAPATKGLIHRHPSGWKGDGKIRLSDGGGATFWQVNNVGRTALIGGLGE
jgi:hypothetical protein